MKSIVQEFKQSYIKMILKNVKLIISLLIITAFSSCEDVIDVNLNTAEPKLVIDASIKWQKGTVGNNQKIKLTTTTSYYNNIIPIVSGATVFIINSTNTVFNFIETPATGEYLCNDFIPIIDETYTLTVIYNGNTYVSTDKLISTPIIETIEQETVQGLSGDEIQIKFFYQDNGLQNNYYLIGFKKSGIIFPEYGVLDDKFFQGNQMFGFYTNEELNPTNTLDMTLQGITLRYYNYMNKLINIAGSAGGSPFATAPATLRGNIINQTNSANYPLGYFHLSEIDLKNYIVL
ncbi:DUF4249 domain-containing protein [Flavobacterium sp.]|uniref:DUF4249 domain-containing protein n=1 Tax=Flavobacterium sp. TaxID=239 RepID=UPI003751250A